jgi:ATP-dependent Clp protease, protease subunit
MATTARMLDEGNDTEKKTEGAAAFQGVAQALYKSRTILIFGEINDKVAERVCAQLLALDSESDADIKIVVSSPGGHVESGDAIHDMMAFVRSRVIVIGTGWVGSIAAHIFIGAKKENRLCTPNTRFLLHQPAGGVRGQASDIEIEAEEIIKMRHRINGIISRETGQTIEKVNEDTMRNLWLGPEEAIAYGLASRIVASVNAI